MTNNDFFSVDKLIEFGLGLGIAQQMVSMMNQSMQSMYIPGSYMAMPTIAFPENIYVAIANEAVGPLTSSEFNGLVKEGKVNKGSLAWLPGFGGWKTVEQIPELLKIIALSPPPLP